MTNTSHDYKKRKRLPGRRLQTAPAQQFQRFHESFNASIKLAIVAIELAKTTETQTTAARTAFRDHFRSTAKEVSTRWGRFCPRNFSKAAETAQGEITRNGILGVFAAFEVFLNSLEGYAKARGPLHPRTRITKVRYPFRLDLAHGKVADVGLTVLELETNRYLLAYFRELRNCIVHQGACADDRLARIANSGQLKDELEGRKLPMIPKIQEGKPIVLEPEHAILGADVCFQLVRAIDRKLFAAYGP